MKFRLKRLEEKLDAKNLEAGCRNLLKVSALRKKETEDNRGTGDLWEDMKYV